MWAGGSNSYPQVDAHRDDLNVSLQEDLGICRSPLLLRQGSKVKGFPLHAASPGNHCSGRPSEAETWSDRCNRCFPVALVEGLVHFWDLLLGLPVLDHEDQLGIKGLECKEPLGLRPQDEMLMPRACMYLSV